MQKISSIQERPQDPFLATTKTVVMFMGFMVMFMGFMVIFMVFMVICMIPDPRPISSRRARKGARSARSADTPP